MPFDLVIFFVLRFGVLLFASGDSIRRLIHRKLSVVNIELSAFSVKRKDLCCLS